MDDCNMSPGAILAEGIDGSDSSMDDCNEISGLNLFNRQFVQIPLWTIVTEAWWGREPDSNMFRFLYGRL